MATVVLTIDHLRTDPAGGVLPYHVQVGTTKIMGHLVALNLPTYEHVIAEVEDGTTAVLLTPDVRLSVRVQG